MGNLIMSAPVFNLSHPPSPDLGAVGITSGHGVPTAAPLSGNGLYYDLDTTPPNVYVWDPASATWKLTN